MHIALVDDNPAILDFMTAVLTMEGHTVSTFLDGASFLQMFYAQGENRLIPPVDLLIVDLWLPGGISGLDIITRLRQTADAEHLHLPIILISGAGQQALAPIEERFPKLLILRKPFTIDALFAAIEQNESQ